MARHTDGVEEDRQLVKRYIEATPLKRSRKQRKEILEALDRIVIYANRQAYRQDGDESSGQQI